VLFTDADCEPDPDWVATLVRAFDDPTVIFAGGEIVGVADTDSLLVRYANAAGILSQRGALTHPRGAFFQTANLAVRREAAEAIGGFDETLYSGGDAEFCWRLQERFPAAPCFVPEARVRHAHREDVAGLFRQFRRYGQADVCLTRRFGVRWVPCLFKAGADVARLLFLPLLAVIGAVRAAVGRDPLPAAAPWLRAVRTVARRYGQLTAWLRPASLYRS
jgi:GT2 family glycosyltransferase